MSASEVFILLLEIVKTTADHSLCYILLYHWTNSFVIVNLFLALHCILYAAQLMLDSVLKFKDILLAGLDQSGLLLLTVFGFSPLIFRYIQKSEFIA